MRAAFEFARLLYALDPWTDPHGALLHLDFLAHKAGMSQWLLDVWDFFATHASNEKAYSGRLVPTALPGWAYARALALYVREEEHRDKVSGCSHYMRNTRTDTSNRIMERARRRCKTRLSLFQPLFQCSQTKQTFRCRQTCEGTPRSEFILMQGTLL